MFPVNPETFQFHKGTIKTGELFWSEAKTLISIP